MQLLSRRSISASCKRFPASYLTIPCAPLSPRGVTTNDDYRSEFALRGAGLNTSGFTLNGMLAENFVHTIDGGHPDGRIDSVINADTVAAVSLMSGAFSANMEIDCGDSGY